MPRCAICKKANSVGNGGLKCKCKGKKMKVEIDLPEIDGFEYTGEYREPKKGEWYYSGLCAVHAEYSIGCCLPILKPVEKWITPTLEYMQEHYKWGEEVEARFSDERDVWVYIDCLCGLEGAIVNGKTFIDSDGMSYRYCEIKEKR